MSIRKDKILDSLEGMKRAQPPADLFDRIQEEIEAQPVTMKPSSRKWMAVAATISILICTNVLLITNYLTDGSSMPVETNPGAYDTIMTDYNLYDL